MKKIGIGIIGLGNIGSRLYKEIVSKKNDIGLKRPAPYEINHQQSPWFIELVEKIRLSRTISAFI